MSNSLGKVTNYGFTYRTANISRYNGSQEYVLHAVAPITMNNNETLYFVAIEHNHKFNHEKDYPMVGYVVIQVTYNAESGYNDNAHMYTHIHEEGSDHDKSAVIRAANRIYEHLHYHYHYVTHSGVEYESKKDLFTHYAWWQSRAREYSKQAE